MSGQGRRKGKKVHAIPKLTGRSGPNVACKHDRVANELLRKMVDDEVERIKEEEDKLKLLRCMAIVDVQMKQLETEMKRREIHQRKPKKRDLHNAHSSAKDEDSDTASAEENPVESVPAEDATRKITAEDAPVGTSDEDYTGADDVSDENAPADEAPTEENPDEEVASTGEAPDDDASSDDDDEGDGGVPTAPIPRVVSLPATGPVAGQGGQGGPQPAPALHPPGPSTPQPPDVQPAPTVANLAAAFADMVSMETAVRAAEAYVDLKNN